MTKTCSIFIDKILFFKNLFKSLIFHVSFISAKALKLTFVMGLRTCYK